MSPNVRSSQVVTCPFTVVCFDHCSSLNIVKHRLHVCFICNIRELTLWIFVEEEDLLDLAREDGHDLGEGGLDVPPLPGLGPPVDDDREPGALQCEDRVSFTVFFTIFGEGTFKRLLLVENAN